MSAPARFTFDLDLAKRAPAAPQQRRDPDLERRHAEEVQRARAEGHAQGLAEGERSASAEAAQRLAQAAESIAQRAAGLLAGLDATRDGMLAEAVDLAAAIARKLAANLLAREPEGEIEALIADCLSSLEGVPHLVIRCHPDQVDRIRALTEARIDQTGFSGRLIVIGEPEIGLTDGRIEWADGGLVRDMNAVSAEIDRSIAAYLAARSNRVGATP
jgi:flagellar assembly protein FliH